MASKCCGLRLTKTFLYVFQIIFLFTGLAICAFGAWKFILTYHLLRVLDNHTFSTAFYLFIATGFLVIFVFFLGCCAIPKHWTKLLFCYIILLLLIFLFEILIGVLAYIFQENIEDDLNLNFNKTILNTYKFDESKTTSIDYVQEKLHCCGAVTFMDWQHSAWVLNDTVSNKVPDSCCKTITEGCGLRDHPSNINLEGCINFIVEKIRINFWLIFLAALGICVFHLIGVIIGIVLFIQLESGKYDAEYSPRNGGTEALLSENTQHHL
ncbi:CD151 antigen-like [Diorhabda carinulata]|uniref:CD151 antigen-like n=1 Tax=Diorhabda sublineata TaxID=1163346 RepID=UPI0024E121BD|nr:CD151 antigen-like [Diorhabda sublineata]XP_057668172.1 CD151 antigen-like [Diorhabda carinulata]